MPYFSIVIPTLNEEKHLPELLTDLEKQTLNDFEVIVVDAESEDDTKKVALGKKDRLNLKLITTAKRGVSYQRNLGVKNSSADKIVFFDADTRIPKSYLAKVLSAFEDKDPDILTTWVKGDSKTENDKIIAAGINTIFEISKILNVPGVLGAMIAVKKSTFNKVNGFNEKLKFGEDSHFLQRIVKKGYKYLILKSPKYTYSLRRYRKDGIFSVIKKSAEMNIKRALKFNSEFDYPMGGHVFAKETKRRSTNSLAMTLEDIRSAIEKLTQQQ